MTTAEPAGDTRTMRVSTCHSRPRRRVRSTVTKGGRVPLYQMGNNSHHEGVLALAWERPGLLVLHDMVLHHLLVEVGHHALLAVVVELLDLLQGLLLEVGQIAA